MCYKALDMILILYTAISLSNNNENEIINTYNKLIIINKDRQADDCKVQETYLTLKIAIQLVKRYMIAGG